MNGTSSNKVPIILLIWFQKFSTFAGSPHLQHVGCHALRDELGEEHSKNHNRKKGYSEGLEGPPKAKYAEVSLAHAEPQKAK